MGGTANGKHEKSGQKEITGQGIMDLQRYADETRHMVVFDIFTWAIGHKGDRERVFLSDLGYQRALEFERSGDIKILRHARVWKGELSYDAHERSSES